MIDDNKKDKEVTRLDTAYGFKLFSYLAMSILTIAILVGLFLILQHMREEDSNAKTIANQETLIQNQMLLKQLLSEAKTHEIREETFLGNNTKTNIKISSSNSEKLDKALVKLDKIIRQLHIPTTMSNVTTG